MGRSPEAIERLGGLLDRLKAEKSPAPADTLLVLVDLGTAEIWAGRYRAALERYVAANALCQKWLNPKGSQCVYGQFFRSQLQLLLGLDAQAMDTVPFLIPPRTPVETAWGTRQLAQAFEVLARNHRLVEHPDVVSRVIAAGDSPADRGENWQARLVALLAEAHDCFREGRFQQATVLSDRAQSLISSLGVGEDRFVLPAHVLQAMSLHALGEHDAALTTLDHVYAAEAKARGAEHPTVQLVSIIRARPLWALQRHPQALALIDHALPILREAMGADAPTVVKLDALRAALATGRRWTPLELLNVELFM
jgi:hypothetical protein